MTRNIICEKGLYGTDTQYNYGSEDIRNYIAFLKEDVGISDQKYLAEAIANLNADAESIRIGGAERSQQLSLGNGVPFLLANGIAKIIMDFLEG